MFPRGSFLKYFPNPNSQLLQVNSFNNLPLSQLVSRSILTAPPNASLQAVAKQMSEASVSCILIMQNRELLGIWTEGDSRKIDFTQPDIGLSCISEHMSAPVISLPANSKLSEAASFMSERKLRRVVVMGENEQPLGVITQTDIVLYQGIADYLRNLDVGSSVHTAPLKLSSTLPLAEAVVKLKNAQLDAALVVNEELNATSIITERDLVKCIAENKTQVTLWELAKHSLVAVSPDYPMQDAVNLMQEKGFRHLGIKDKSVANQAEQITGLLSLTDILTSIEYAYVNQLRTSLDSHELALETSAANLYVAEKVIAASLDGIIITDAKGIIQAVNPSFTRLTGYTPKEALGGTPAMLNSGKQSKEFYQHMWQSLSESGYWQGEIWNKRKNGEIYPEWLTITAISHNKEGKVQQFAAIFSDITDRKLKEKQIHHLAYYDGLTGLANRRLFIDITKTALEQASNNHHKLGILFLDLDLFKRINESLGHEAGDKVLKEVAKILASSVSQDDLVARICGDEFIILVPEIESLHLLEVLAKKIIKKLSAPLTIQNNSLVISSSIGISIYPEDGKDVETLIKNADTAMYQAKDLGRNNYRFYNQEMGMRSSSDLTLENGLRRALKENYLHLAYQPQVDVCTGQWVGMEALLRWNDPQLGFISPGEFIPLAEKVGLIEQLGNWVLEEVIQQLQTWIKQGLNPPPVAVNVSARQLQNKDFANNVFKLLEHYQVPANLLEIELTESCLIVGEEDDQYNLLYQLDSKDVQISMDDFGTGYSSLSYIRRLPLSTIKIDVSFVAELPESSEDAQLVKAIISMAKALGMKVVAEGVEKPEQAEMLYQLGSSVCQGYGIAMPSKKEDITRWLEASSNQAWPNFSAEWQFNKNS